ncbi:MAG: hypothetical protein ACYTXC_01450 [Nostoc sp.]
MPPIYWGFFILIKLKNCVDAQRQETSGFRWLEPLRQNLRSLIS